MVPMHSIYNSILCLLFRSQLMQHCILCILVCSSDMEAFLEFPKESESDIRMKDWSSEQIPSLFFSFKLFLYIYLQRGKNFLYCVSSSEFLSLLKLEVKIFMFLSVLLLLCCCFCPELYIKQLLSHLVKESCTDHRH